MMARTERESERKKKQEKWQTCWCCRDQQRACRMAQASVEILEHTGPAEKKRMTSVPQRVQLESTPEPRLPRGIGTQPYVPITRSCEGRVKVSKCRTVARERGCKQEHGKERVNSTVKASQFQGKERGQAERQSLAEVGKRITE